MDLRENWAPSYQELQQYFTWKCWESLPRLANMWWTHNKCILTLHFEFIQISYANKMKHLKLIFGKKSSPKIVIRPSWHSELIVKAASS
jgi:hypothetical protein